MQIFKILAAVLIAVTGSGCAVMTPEQYERIQQRAIEREARAQAHRSAYSGGVAVHEHRQQWYREQQRRYDSCSNPPDWDVAEEWAKKGPSGAQTSGQRNVQARRDPIQNYYSPNGECVYYFNGNMHYSNRVP